MKRSTCDYCEAAPALVYCRADSARLCLSCDRHVHAANSVSERHSRSLVCDACSSAPSSILRGRLLLCPNCDFDATQSEGGLPLTVERRPVEPYSGCPGAEELTFLLGVPPFEEKIALVEDSDEDFGWVWTIPPVLSVEDLLLPLVTVADELPASGVPPPPRDRNLGCGRNKEEILRQLQGLEFSLERESLGDSYQAMQLDCLETSGRELASTEQLQETAVVEDRDLIDNNVATVVSGERALPPPASHSKTPAHDRHLVISRYKEKRKTRRYDNQIRYESRKARAEGRVRIKGRFAKLGRFPNT